MEYGVAVNRAENARFSCNPPGFHAIFAFLCGRKDLPALRKFSGIVEPVPIDLGGG